jgi:hypothetical protein
MRKWQAWYNNQPQHIKDWIDHQPRAVWHDKDVAFFVSVALAVGFFFGYIAH